MELLTPYSLSRGAPSASRASLRELSRLHPCGGNRPHRITGQSTFGKPGVASAAIPSSFWMRWKISSRCTATSFGAVMPIRTWLPLTPSTVTVTESPIIRVSPTLRVRISMAPSGYVPAPARTANAAWFPTADRRPGADGRPRPDAAQTAADALGGRLTAARRRGAGSADARGDPVADARQRGDQRRTIAAAALRHVGPPAALAADLRGDVRHQFAGLHLAERG